MLIYGICYYYGVNKIKNIINHVNAFNNIKKTDDIFCLNIMVDSDDNNLYTEIENKFSKMLEINNIVNYKILVDYNSGGTILGLYNTFNYFKNNDRKDYIAFFEEDFYGINDKWLNDSINKLNNNNHIYIGEHQPSGGAVLNDNYLHLKEKNIYDMDKTNCWNLSFSDILNKHNCKISDDNILCWTDGGYYFSSIDNFNKIYEKIGIFHKGNKKKYNHEIDGIILGEVGFPSQIKKHFNFIGLMRNKYFTHK